MAVNFNIGIDAGSTFQVIFAWKDAASEAIDMTGYSARMQLRMDLGQANPDLSLATGSGITITAADGEILVEIEPATTETMTGSYFYDLEVESPTGVVTRLCQGTVTVSSEVTRE
jgi:hypothetical protein